MLSCSLTFIYLLFLAQADATVYIPPSFVARSPALAGKLRERSEASLQCVERNLNLSSLLYKVPGKYVHCDGPHARSLTSLCVPRIVHHTWRSTEVPVEERKYVDTWVTQNAGWLSIVWDDVAIDELISTQLPYYWPLYQAYPASIMRADAARLVVIYFYGGIYADLDFETFRSVDEVMKMTRGIGFIGHERGMSAALFAAHARHTFLRNALRLMQQSYEEAQRGVGWFLWHERVINTNGPHFIKKVLNFFNESICWMDYLKWSPCDGCGICQPKPWFGYHHMSGRWHHWSSGLSQTWSCYRLRAVTGIISAVAVLIYLRRHLLLRLRAVIVTLFVVVLIFLYSKEPTPESTVLRV